MPTLHHLSDPFPSTFFSPEGVEKRRKIFAAEIDDGEDGVLNNQQICIFGIL